MRRLLVAAFVLLTAAAGFALTDDLVAEIITEFYTASYTGLSEQEIFNAYGTDEAELNEYLDNLSEERLEAIFTEVDRRYGEFQDQRFADIYGEPPAAFTAPMLGGGDFGLAELLDEGKVVFVNIFATWCPPCRAEIPAFLELLDEIEDFAVVGVSVDDFAEVDELAAFAGEQGIDYPLVLYSQTGEEAMAYYSAEAVPTTWVVAPDGEVVKIIVGSREKEEFRELIEDLL